MKFSMTGQNRWLLNRGELMGRFDCISTQILSVYITQTQRIYKAI